MLTQKQIDTIHQDAWNNIEDWILDNYNGCNWYEADDLNWDWDNIHVTLSDGEIYIVDDDDNDISDEKTKERIWQAIPSFEDVLSEIDEEDLPAEAQHEISVSRWYANNEDYYGDYD